MSDGQDTRDPATLARATEMGWRDKPVFKGNPDLWVDADEYVRRGEQVLPLVKAENRRLTEKTDQLSGEIVRLTAAINEQRESMTEMAKFNSEQLKERLTEQKRQLTADLRAANKAEDDVLAGQLEERLEENAEAREALRKVPAAPASAPAAPQTVQETPEYKAWQTANPWFGGSSRLEQAKTAAAQQFGKEAAAAGKRGTAFFQAVDEAMAEAYPQQRRQDPTEDGRPRGGTGSDSSSDSGFKGLPAEAKAKAKEQASRFVGPNKMFKKEDDWYAYYAKQYNTEAA